MRLILVSIFMFLSFEHILAQSVQTGIGVETVSAGVTLQLQGINKGFLIPKVSLTSKASQSPLTGTLTTGTTIFNTNTFGNFPNEVFPGYYYWDQKILQWKPLAENDYSASAKFFNTSVNTDFYNGTNVIEMDLMGSQYYNENPDIIKKISNTKIEIGATGLYEITVNFAFRKIESASRSLGIACSLRLNGLIVGTTRYLRTQDSAGDNGNINSASFTEFIQVNEGQLLSVTTLRATDANVVDLSFSEVGSSSIQVKRVR